MVEVKKQNPEIAREYCEEFGIEYITGETELISAKDGSKTIGNCVFDLTEEKITIKFIEPEKEADSMLRSALFIAANKGIMEAFYKEPVKSDLISRLGFVKNLTDCSIDITNLFLNCENCKKR